jgi:hypothetical protein
LNQKVLFVSATLAYFLFSLLVYIVTFEFFGCQLYYSLIAFSNFFADCSLTAISHASAAWQYVFAAANLFNRSFSAFESAHSFSASKQQPCLVLLCRLL